MPDERPPKMRATVSRPIPASKMVIATGWKSRPVVDLSVLSTALRRGQSARTTNAAVGIEMAT